MGQGQSALQVMLIREWFIVMCLCLIHCLTFTPLINGIGKVMVVGPKAQIFGVLYLFSLALVAFRFELV